MKYLVIMELIGVPPVASPQQLAQHLDQRIIPTHDALMKLQKEKKILAGGDLSGRRGMALIMETASSEELTSLLMALPCWSMMKVEVTPLDGWEQRQAEQRKMLEHLKRL